MYLDTPIPPQTQGEEFSEETLFTLRLPRRTLNLEAERGLVSQPTDPELEHEQ